ncbi:MAG TPA: NlpC/P60 family protein [Propionibacteriaceae bacterium]|nr:NlpC/P60 family protein [Propionibacteriaceae bacterium]
MPTDDQARPARLRIRTLTAAAVATITALVVVPGVGYADPQPTMESVQAQVDQLNTEAAMAAERYNDARLKLDEVQQKLASAQALAGTQEQKVASARSGLAAFASATYRTGGIDPTVLLVASEDPEEFLASSSSLARLTDRQAASLRSVIAERTQLQQDNALVAEQLGDLAEAKAEVERQKSEIDSKLAQAEQVLNTLKEEERQRLLAAQRAARDQERAAADAARAAAPEPEEERPTYTGSASGAAAVAVAFAYDQLGDRYVYGASGPNAWDCSGLTMMAWQAGGKSLPHYSAGQYSTATPIKIGDLRPGDLLFWGSKPSSIYHVALYVGDGMMIHAPRTGRNVEEVSMYYWITPNFYARP